MPRLRWIVAPLLIVAALAGGFWVAWRHEPAFYSQELARDAQAQRESSDELLATATALVSQARNKPQFSALISAEQINGWLAVDLRENHPDLLPPDVSDPRLAIRPGEATIAWRQTIRGTSTVVSVRVDAFVSQQHELGIRIRGARAGAVPLPVGEFLDDLTDTAREANLVVRVSQEQGDPVLLISFDASQAAQPLKYLLDSVELRDGAIYVAGRSSSGDERKTN